jgi:hypothetical protein
VIQRQAIVLARRFAISHVVARRRLVGKGRSGMLQLRSSVDALFKKPITD